MHCLVTGAAGFIGSHLTRRLSETGNEITAIDAFTPYYDVSIKRRRTQDLQSAGISVLDADLLSADLERLLDGVDVVYHLAGQPGVRSSWDAGFADYLSLNVLATQRLLEAAKSSGLTRLVYASSSSVYGDAQHYPTTESDPCLPVSPYGVTKLAAENLCRVYASNWQVPTVSLRFFTVYGPGQRPDMAMHRFLTAVLQGQAVPLFGDGEQVRDFTYVADVVAACIAAGSTPSKPGEVLNVAGGASVSVNELLALIEQVTGHQVKVDRKPTQAGDVVRTGGSTERILAKLGWRPSVSVADGLSAHWQALSGREETRQTH